MLAKLQKDTALRAEYEKTMTLLGLTRVLQSPASERLYTLWLLGVEQGINRSLDACGRVANNTKSRLVKDTASICIQEIKEGVA